MNPGRASDHDASRRLMIGFTIIAALAILLPMFFETYRQAYFRTVSFDDYSRFLLWALGEPGGALPPSPHTYRLGAVVLAMPFYYLPPIVFSGQGIDNLAAVPSGAHLRALQAMCLANIVFVALAATVAGAWLHTRRHVSLEWSLVAAFLIMMLSHFLGLAGVDGIAMLPAVLIAITLLERRLLPFAVAVGAGVFINEKLVLVPLFTAALRAVFETRHRRDHVAMALIAGIVLAAFVAAVALLRFPGLDNQRDPSTYLAAIAAMAHDLLRPKGAYQNLFPVALLIGLWGIGMAMPRENRILCRCDVGVIGLMVVMSLALDVKYNVGRITMFAFPLFVLGAIQALDHARRHATTTAKTTTTTAGDRSQGLARKGHQSP